MLWQFEMFRLLYLITVVSIKSVNFCIQQYIIHLPELKLYFYKYCTGVCLLKKISPLCADHCHGRWVTSFHLSYWAQFQCVVGSVFLAVGFSSIVRLMTRKLGPIHPQISVSTIIIKYYFIRAPMTFAVDVP